MRAIKLASLLSERYSIIKSGNNWNSQSGLKQKSAEPFPISALLEEVKYNANLQISFECSKRCLHKNKQDINLQSID